MSTRKALRILWQTGLACLIVLAGWGLSCAGLYFAESARAAFLVVLLARNTLEILFLTSDPFATRRALGGYQRWVPAISRLAMLFLCWFLPFADRRSILTIPSAETLRYVGVALFAAGAGVQLAAVRTLGRQYSVHVTLQNEHKLVQDGVYKAIRHPMYLGLMMIFAGVPLVFRSWLVFPVFLLFSLFVAWRIHNEEKLLREEFAAEFESYRRRTKLLVPHLC